MPYYNRKLGLKKNTARNAMPAWFDLKKLPQRSRALRGTAAKQRARKQHLYYVTHKAAIKDTAATYRRLNKATLKVRAQQLAEWHATPIGTKYQPPTVADPTWRRPLVRGKSKKTNLQVHLQKVRHYARHC